jgi:hypothetical protein
MFNNLNQIFCLFKKHPMSEARDNRGNRLIHLSIRSNTLPIAEMSVEKVLGWEARDKI